MTRSINALVIHCSASPNGQRVGVEEIDRWHHTRGFLRRQPFLGRQNPELASIGYHFVIYTSGTVATGRHLDEVGAHVQGNNSKSIGICMVGTDRFTPAQWDSLAKCVRALLKSYPEARVLGHRDYSPDLDGDGVIEPHEWLKICPGFDVTTWLAAGMKPAIAHLLELDPANDASAAEPPEAA